jgi:hypothetical protein
VLSDESSSSALDTRAMGQVSGTRYYRNGARPARAVGAEIPQEDGMKVVRTGTRISAFASVLLVGACMAGENTADKAELGVNPPMGRREAVARIAATSTLGSRSHR